MLLPRGIPYLSDKQEFKHLGARLRAERPTPRSGLISAIVARIRNRVQHHPKASLRFALAGKNRIRRVAAGS